MKKNIVMIVIVALILVVGVTAILLMNGNNRAVSAGNTDPQPQAGNSASNEEPGYTFEYKDVKIAVEAPSAAIVEALGEPTNYFEAPSCAFVGMDKIYTYGGLEFQTYTEGEKDYIATIRFLDDSITTPEGIGLNASVDDVIAAYGSEYKQSFNQYTYTKGRCNLSFIIENNEVVSVEYASVDFGKEQP